MKGTKTIAQIMREHAANAPACPLCGKPQAPDVRLATHVGGRGSNGHSVRTGGFQNPAQGPDFCQCRKNVRGDELRVGDFLTRERFTIQEAYPIEDEIKRDGSVRVVIVAGLTEHGTPIEARFRPNVIVSILRREAGE